jgi:hypothetical protein
VYATAITDDNTHGAAWGDFDGDGDLDIAFGNDGSGAPVRVYENQGDDSFSLVWSASGATGRVRDVAWCDYDGDGNLDIVAAARDAKNSIYRNDPAATPRFSVAWESAESEATHSVDCASW